MWFMLKMIQHNNTLYLKQGKTNFFSYLFKISTCYQKEKSSHEIQALILLIQSADAQNYFKQNSRQILKKIEK